MSTDGGLIVLPTDRSGTVVLDRKHTLAVRPNGSFHFDGTVHKSSHFPTPFRRHEPGRYHQSLRWGGRHLGIRLIDAGDEVELTVFAQERLKKAELESIATELTWRFDLASDLGEFETRFAVDPVLGPAIDRWRGTRVSSAYSLYEFLAVAVVLQNTTVRRSTQMLGALFDTFGTKIAFDGLELAAFWSPADVAATTEDALRALKVGYRAKTLHRAARSFAAGTVDEFAIRPLPGELQRKHLLDIYGVGPASVSYLLFEVFHNYDVFDVLPPWEQKIYSRLLFDAELEPAEVVLAEVKRRWGPWRMLAAHYVFENLFWEHRRETIPWLADLIRL